MIELASKDYTEKTEKFNINIPYLLGIYKNIEIYRAAWYNDDLEVMLKALHQIEAESSPKIDNDEIEKNLQELDLKISRITTNDVKGKVVAYNPNTLKEVQTLLNKTFKLLMVKLEKKVMLTFQMPDPGKAMSRMED